MEKKKHTNTKLQDEGRLAHMIAWRDKRIAALEELLQAHEQAGSIYAAYVAHLLERCGEPCAEGCELVVSKEEIRRTCGKYRIGAKDAGESFVITLYKTGDV